MSIGDLVRDNDTEGGEALPTEPVSDERRSETGLPGTAAGSGSVSGGALWPHSLHVTRLHLAAQ